MNTESHHYVGNRDNQTEFEQPAERLSVQRIRDPEAIGEGGFGIVYRAYDHQLERTIAIKEYMPTSLAKRNDDLSIGLRGERFGKTFRAGLNSFIQEARLLARFAPRPAARAALLEENGTAYMGTQFYSGTTLKNLQAQQPEKIDEAWIRRLLPPLFSAINTIHQEGYLHRDISLDNIQIRESQLPVLLDFGSARKEIGNLSDETEIMLKPASRRSSSTPRTATASRGLDRYLRAGRRAAYADRRFAAAGQRGAQHRRQLSTAGRAPPRRLLAGAAAHRRPRAGAEAGRPPADHR